MAATPGPWHVQPNRLDKTELLIVAGDRSDPRGWVIVARIGGGREITDEDRANAEKIAAAGGQP
jgi:hypothetical protein